MSEAGPSKVRADSVEPMPDGNRFPVLDLAGEYALRQVQLSTEDDVINTGIITCRIKALTQAERLSILIVDDDEIELALVGDQLEARGFDVVRHRTVRKPWN